MSRVYCVDFDDLCDQVAGKTLEVLGAVKRDYPAFKCTLFTIPRRTSDSTIADFKKLDWVALAPHGYDHTRGECLAWTSYEASEKIREAAARGIDAPCFRAPAWLIDRETYEACAHLGYTVCDHREFRSAHPGAKVYTYNNPVGRKRVQPVHGHLTNCRVDNHILDMAQDGRLTFAAKSSFVYPWEAAMPNYGKDADE